MDLFSLELDAGSPLLPFLLAVSLDLSLFYFDKLAGTEKPKCFSCLRSPISGAFWPEYEALELILRKGPVEEPLRGPPASILTSQPVVQLSPPTGEVDVLIGDDEMEACLHSPIDVTDTTANLNRQTEAVSSNTVPSVLGGKAELDYQLLEPVLPENDAKKLDSQVATLKTNTVFPEKAGGSGLGRRKNNGKDKSRFDGHNKLTKRDSLMGSKFSTINSDKMRKEAVHRSMSSRNLRIIKNHNLSERRRRSRINERMEKLQELIPISAKLDKAAILDATIAQVKSLQKQVKILSMGCPMTPPMFPTGPPYIQSMPSMASMDIGMGRNRNITASMNIPAMGMQPFGPAIVCPHINQPIQAPILQMPHPKMAPEMFPYSLIGEPYDFPHVVPGQVSPQVAMEAQDSHNLQDISSVSGYFAL